jgi:hypothetical protein
MNWSTMLAVAKTEALAVADKLVAKTRGRQMGTYNNQLRQRFACRGHWWGSGGAMPACYILEEKEWIGIVEVGRPLVCGRLG